MTTKAELQKQSDELIAQAEKLQTQAEQLQKQVAELKDDKEWDDPEPNKFLTIALYGHGLITNNPSVVVLNQYWRRGRLGSEEYLEDYDKKEIARATIMRYREHMDAVPDSLTSGIPLFNYYYHTQDKKLTYDWNLFVIHPEVIYFSKEIPVEDLPQIVVDAYMTLLGE